MYGTIVSDGGSIENIKGDILSIAILQVVSILKKAIMRSLTLLMFFARSYWTLYQQRPSWALLVQCPWRCCTEG